MDDKSNAILFFKKVFFLYRFSYYGILSIEYLEKYLSKIELDSLYEKYEKKYQKDILSKDKEIKNFYLQYNFSTREDIFFKKFLFYLYIGEYYTSMKYFEQYKNTYFIKENYKKFYLIFSKLFFDRGFFQLSIDYANKAIQYLNNLSSSYYEFKFLISFKYPVIYIKEIKKALDKYNKHMNLSNILSFIHSESRFFKLAKSPSGAIGLMQLMPETAIEIISKLNLDININEIYDEKININLGVFYLNWLTKFFEKVNLKKKNILIVGGYNAGPSGMKMYLKEYKKKFQKNKLLVKDMEYFIETISNTQVKKYIKKYTRINYIYKTIVLN